LYYIFTANYGVNVLVSGMIISLIDLPTLYPAVLSVTFYDTTYRLAAVHTLQQTADR